MDMICLHAKSANGPDVGFTDAADFLFEKRGEFPNQNLLAVFWAPDKMVAELVIDMPGMLRIHAFFVTDVLILVKSMLRPPYP